MLTNVRGTRYFQSTNGLEGNEEKKKQIGFNLLNHWSFARKF